MKSLRQAVHITWELFKTESVQLWLSPIAGQAYVCDFSIQLFEFSEFYIKISWKLIWFDKWSTNECVFVPQCLTKTSIEISATSWLNTYYGNGRDTEMGLTVMMVTKDEEKNLPKRLNKALEHTAFETAGCRSVTKYLTPSHRFIYTRA